MYCSIEIIAYVLGVLHMWKRKPRSKTFRRARDIRAILWVPVLA